jgi:hypothetical protein
MPLQGHTLKRQAFMLRNDELKIKVERRRPVDARLKRALFILCALVVASSGAWLIISYAQSKRGAGVTRPRRAEEPERAGAMGVTNTGNSNNQMSYTDKEKRTEGAAVGFYKALEGALKARGLRLEEVCDRMDPVGRRILEDYGAVFVAARNVQPPPVCIFRSAEEVERFQAEAQFRAAVVGGSRIELQPAAMEALLDAREEARARGLDITPRGGTEAARRSYQDTVRLWNTRFLPALSYWMKRGRLSKAEVARLKALSLTEQVREVLELEKSGIFFSKDLSKSILYSIAAPGTSQHIMMLALDVEQFMDARVRRILADHGWFQTVKSDLPHFTYLGLEEKELPARGLRPVESGSQLFWIPNVE